MARMTLSALAAQVAALTTAVQALAATIPASSATAGSPTAEPVHIGPSGKPDGRKFACDQCGKLFRSAGTPDTAGLAWHKFHMHSGS